MRIKTVTWNIGGGKHLKDGDDPLLMASYSIDAIAEIAKLIGYDFSFFDATSSSHIDEGKVLGNGVISRYPIEDHRTIQRPGPGNYRKMT